MLATVAVAWIRPATSYLSLMSLAVLYPMKEVELAVQVLYCYTRAKGVTLYTTVTSLTYTLYSGFLMLHIAESVVQHFPV